MKPRGRSACAPAAALAEIGLIDRERIRQKAAPGWSAASSHHGGHESLADDAWVHQDACVRPLRMKLYLCSRPFLVYIFWQRIPIRCYLFCLATLDR